ncbi:OPT oligopeptide transporter protein-domain-containing protein [Phlyctochytrium arcticum]|nr:OPT oligopeptide transporter protein-domain-containing protein [Phlyctochytrium arcticum]
MSDVQVVNVEAGKRMSEATTTNDSSSISSLSAELDSNVGSAAQINQGDKSVAQQGDRDPDDVWQYIDAVVDKTDDTTLPSLTPRAWLLGTFFTILFSIVNAVLTFRTNPFNLPVFVAILLILPAGKFLARILPKGRFNTGPFSIKEHALCGVMVGSAFIPLGVFNFVCQKYLFHQSGLSLLSGVGFVVGSQFIGFGLAGHCRKFLVRPASMLWPSALTSVALYRALNKTTDSDRTASTASEAKSRSFNVPVTKFFWMVFVGAAVYQVFPGFVAPLLSSLSILCVSSSRDVRLWGSGFPGRGMGFLSISLDWSMLGKWMPLESPFWTKVNQFFGVYLVLYIIVPILYYTNAFTMDQNLKDPVVSPFGAVNTLAMFNKTGLPIRPQMLLKPDGAMNDALYNAQKPIFISSFYAVTIALALFGYVATLSHTALWYGKIIQKRFSRGIREAEEENIHCRLMRAYPEVPNWWYGAVLSISIPLVMVTCQWGGFALSWWGVLLAIALAIVSMLPVGILQALSGQQLPLQTISYFLSGIVFGGQTFAVLSFNTVAYMGMAQGLVLVKDLKIAHYMKIPPRDMFLAQLWGKLVSAIVMTLTAAFVMENWQETLLKNTQWLHTPYKSFSTNAVIWGSIGTLRFFGAETPYQTLLWAFPAGLLAPVIPWLCYRKWGGNWRWVNVPLMVMLNSPVNSFQTTVVPFVISFMSTYYMRRKHNGLWSKYNYILAAGLSAGTAVTVLVLGIPASQNVKMPTWFMNPTDGDYCLHK